MKTRQIKSSSKLLVALLSAGLAGATHSQTSDEAAIRSLENQERGAVLSANVGALTQIWSEKMMVNSPRGRVSENRAEAIKLVQAGVIRYSSFERSIESMRVSGELAVVMGSETVVPDGPAPGAGQLVKRRFTNIWQRDGSTWRMVARHANIVTDAIPK